MCHRREKERKLPRVYFLGNSNFRCVHNVKGTLIVSILCDGFVHLHSFCYIHLNRDLCTFYLATSKYLPYTRGTLERVSVYNLEVSSTTSRFAVKL